MIIELANMRTSKSNKQAICFFMREKAENVVCPSLVVLQHYSARRNIETGKEAGATHNWT
jgi:hypothetical protein